MALVSGQLALAAAGQRLSNVYGGASLGNVVAAAQDVPIRQLLLIAEGADAFLGTDATVTSSLYGTKVDSTENVPVMLGPFNNGPIKLSDIWVAGSGSTLHVFAIGY